MLKAEDIMNSVISIDKETSIGETISKMLKEKISRILISEDKKITKIVSQKDICSFLLEKQNEAIDEIPIERISKKILSVNPTENIKTCTELMISKNIGSLGIKSDKIIGILTKTDIVKIIQNELKGKKSAVEIMSNDYLWEFSNVTISKIFKKMFDFNISRLILKDENEIPVGIITMSDLLKLGFTDFNTNSINETKLDTNLLFHRFNSEKISGNKISTKEILSVPMTEDISKICSLLLNQRINGLGVLNDNNIIWGILTKTDILKAFINK
ncbi:MAG: CBS domain-containing protein [Candidatus Nitrosopumilus sp. bin_32a]